MSSENCAKTSCFTWRIEFVLIHSNSCKVTPSSTDDINRTKRKYSKKRQQSTIWFTWDSRCTFALVFHSTSSQHVISYSSSVVALTTTFELRIKKNAKYKEEKGRAKQNKEALRASLAAAANKNGAEVCRYLRLWNCILVGVLRWLQRRR